MKRLGRFLKRLGSNAIWSALVVLLALVTFSVSSVRMSGQSVTADLVGTVTDSTGAIVPGADITVTNKGTGAVRQIKSAGDGNFAVTNLPSGSYSVTVVSASFKTFEVPNLTLAAGDKPRIDAKLQVGGSSEIVSVEATTPLLQSESSTLQSSVNQQAVQDMPLNGRNFVQLNADGSGRKRRPAEQLDQRHKAG